MLTEEQRAAVEALRIPVDGQYPGTYWIICLDEESSMPTPAELEMLKSYQEYSVRNYYNDWYSDRILAQPLPADAGHNTVIFKRDRAGHWFYRRMTWQHGHVPFLDRGELLTLTQVMDRTRNTLPATWEEWKANHADIFQREMAA